jgi:hypothetical protein
MHEAGLACAAVRGCTMAAAIDAPAILDEIGAAMKRHGVGS